VHALIDYGFLVDQRCHPPFRSRDDEHAPEGAILMKTLEMLAPNFSTVLHTSTLNGLVPRQFLPFAISSGVGTLRSMTIQTTGFQIQ
jgi:hypothetical protein